VTTTTPPGFPISCPVPDQDRSTVQLAHGGGGRLSNELLETVILPRLAGPLVENRHDGAVLETGGSRVAFTTDSYVVRPLFFPGGDIGTLAVNGTVNDLAMCGARPIGLSISMILEEGLPIGVLERVAESIRDAAQRAGVPVVTGDTKVVERARGDGMYLNSSGVGLVVPDRPVEPGRVGEGDAVIISGDIARHGIAVMAERESLGFEPPIESDCAPLWDSVAALFDAGHDVHCLRDLTRGGLASSLVEIASAARVGIELDESAIPVDDGVRGACEILGLDPLHVANEGRFVCFVPGGSADAVVQTLRGTPGGGGCRVIGTVTRASDTPVTIRTVVGTHRVVDMLSGEQLPRIC
jgi:hydrogenase expression/formation protein HypE